MLALPANPDRNHLVLIDGMSFLFRAYHAVRGNLSRSDGFPTNALFGFTQMLVKVVKDLRPQACAVVLDSPPPNWRHHLYTPYKANRPPPDEPLKLQLGKLEDLIRAFGLPILRQNDVEADDLIATAVAQAVAHKTPYSRVTIVTSDKDLLQLVGEFDNNGTPTVVRLLDTFKDSWQGPERAEEKFGVPPSQVRDVQALMGDSSDNIPGVPGVGPKTAAQLIRQFGSLDNLYANLAAVEKESLRKKLAENEQGARISYQLVGLKSDCPLPPDLDLSFNPSYETAARYLQTELEFNTLAARMLRQNGGQNGTGKAPPPQTSAQPPKNPPSTSSQPPQTSLNLHAAPWGPYTTISTQKAWQELLQAIKKQGFCALDTETTSLDPYRADLVGLSFATAPGQAYYVPLGHVTQHTEKEKLFADSARAEGQPDAAPVLADLKALLADKNINKIMHNAKYDWLVLARTFGIIPDDTGPQFHQLFQNVNDTMLLSACLHGGKWNHNLDDLSERHLDHKNMKYKDICGTGRSQISFAEVPVEQATFYAAEDADATLRLWQYFLSLQKLPGIYTDVEMPLLPTVAALEARGVCINGKELKSLSVAWQAELEQLSAEICRLAGKDFNVNSPAQLAVVLFDDMKLGTPAQQKKRSTASDVLESIGESDDEKAHGITAAMLRYRQLAKLRSTYAEALVGEINPLTRRIHTSYHQIGAATGRFSSSDPNLQNIPIRTEEGRKIRHAFVPQAGWVMVAADYSQIELRLLAHFSGSTELKQAFAEGLDIHAYTAALVAGKPIEDVSKEERRAAKFVNFGLVYGMGARSLAGQIGCTMAEAQQWIDAYFERYKGVKQYMEANKQAARDKGYVETIFGRKVWLPEIHSANGGLRANAERAAINAPLQGSNADIIKKAMPRVEHWLQEHGHKAQILMQVHDELVLECPPDEVNMLQTHLPRLMSDVAHISVPLVVEVGHGPNWEEAH